MYPEREYTEKRRREGGGALRLSEDQQVGSQVETDWGAAGSGGAPLPSRRAVRSPRSWLRLTPLSLAKQRPLRDILLLSWGEKPKQTVLSRRSEVRTWSQIHDWLEPYQLPALSLLLMLDILPGLGRSVTQHPGKKLRALRSGIYNKTSLQFLCNSI